jgi:hypothetical protein
VWRLNLFDKYHAQFVGYGEGLMLARGCSDACRNNSLLKGQMAAWNGNDAPNNLLKRVRYWGIPCSVRLFVPEGRE